MRREPQVIIWLNHNPIIVALYKPYDSEFALSLRENPMAGHLVVGYSAESSFQYESRPDCSEGLVSSIDVQLAAQCLLFTHKQPAAYVTENIVAYL